ncbi:MAG TPA: SAM-dependent methyltransferase, partial [Clostridiales bacterium]|nr:SAM-dependent methyltransferase [Clostridiales bacterium]
MEELNGYIEKVLSENPVKIILSNPLDKTGKYRKINITKKASGFQVETLTETQAFHSVISGDEVLDFLLEFMKNIFTQLNAFTPEIEYSVKLTKKGRVLFSKRKLKKSPVV